MKNSKKTTRSNLPNQPSRCSGLHRRLTGSCSCWSWGTRPSSLAEWLAGNRHCRHFSAPRLSGPDRTAGGGPWGLSAQRRTYPLSVRFFEILAPEVKTLQGMDESQMDGKKITTKVHDLENHNYQSTVLLNKCTSSATAKVDISTAIMKKSSYRTK